MLVRMLLREHQPVPFRGAIALVLLCTVWAGCGGDGGESSSGSATYTVSSDGSRDFMDIQSCIRAASAGDTCRVYPGTYGPISFLGKGLTVQAANGPDSTIIDAGAAGTAAVAFTHSETVASVLSGFTIRNGNALGSGTGSAFNGDTAPAAAGDENGGGIRILASSPVIENCVVRDNHADGEGGGIFIAFASSRPLIRETTFENNTADGDGGGLYAFSGFPDIQDSVFRGNVALNGGAAGVAFNSRAQFSEVEFRENTAAQQGGGLYAYMSSPEVTNSTFDSNAAPNGSAACASSGSYISFENCTFLNNNADCGSEACPGQCQFTPRFTIQ